MRITTGELGGRVLKVPKGIRPTQDMVRQALFSSLGERVVDARVLELFAGSGALGLEAWSRGAASVTWVEADHRVLAVLESNVAGLCGRRPELRVVKGDALRFLEGYAGEPFDLLLADPPYDKQGERGWLGKTLRVVESRPILREEGLLVFELGADESLPPMDGWTLLRDKMYGATRLLILARRTTS